MYRIVSKSNFLSTSDETRNKSAVDTLTWDLTIRQNPIQHKSFNERKSITDEVMRSSFKDSLTISDDQIDNLPNNHSDRTIEKVIHLMIFNNFARFYIHFYF